MTMSADIRAALRLDRSQFTRGIGEAKGEVRGLKDIAREIGPALVGAFSVGAVTGFVKHQAEAAKVMLNFADQVGISTDAVQALDNAATANGSSSDKMRQAMSKLKDTLGDARNGSTAAAEALARLGVTQDMIASSDLPAALAIIAQRWRDGSADASVYADVQATLGKGAGELKGTLTAIADQSLPGLTAAFKDSGQAIENDVLRSMREYDRALDDIKTKMAAVGTTSAVVMVNGLRAAFRNLMGENTDDLFSFEGQTETVQPADRMRAWSAQRGPAAGYAGSDAHKEQLMREQFAKDQQAFDARRRAAEAKRKQEAEVARAVEAAQADIAKAQEAARGELSRLFAASAPHVTPAAEINRVGGFVGGQRDARAEAAIDQRKLQQEGNRIVAELRRDVAEIKAQLRQKTGPAQV